MTFIKDSKETSLIDLPNLEVLKGSSYGYHSYTAISIYQSMNNKVAPHNVWNSSISL